MSELIVIPIYKIQLTDDEIISLTQCFKILGNHTIKFVAPLGLDIAFYERLLDKKIEIEYFDTSYFMDIRGYNQLMLSVEFYKRFIDFKYMLIYQLDCYVFRDELDYWCQQGYDYIGAPWLDHFYYKKSKIKKLDFLIKRFLKLKFNKYQDKDILTYNVGNGGFSLRNIHQFIHSLKKTDKQIIDKFRNSNDPKSIFNEDVFWSFDAKKIKKPNYKVAANFSLDLGADIGIRLNKGNLPFGCHAWNKKYHYWTKYILNENLNHLTI